MKFFNDELYKFYLKLQANEKFAFSKYADGEWLAMTGVNSTPGNGEWVINADKKTQYSRRLLITSFKYKDPGYYVGISCPCCQGNNHKLMKEFSGQDEEHLTFANLFVNANYPLFLKHFIPEFQKRRVILVANENTDVTQLPFEVEDFLPVKYNAWVDNLSLLDSMRTVKAIQEKNLLYLFSCGPLGNILAAGLWHENKNHTYLDIGSTIDKWTNNDFMNKRCYAEGVKGYSDKICVWGE